MRNDGAVDFTIYRDGRLGCAFRIGGAGSISACAGAVDCAPNDGVGVGAIGLATLGDGIGDE